VLVLRALAEDHATAVGAALSRGAAADIARVVPEYVQWAGDDPGPVSAAIDGEAARFRFFDAVGALLRRLAARVPLAIILDDLHWADVSSLRLVEFVAGALREAPLLLLCTYRDTEVPPDSPLAATLSVLAREPALERVNLHGLSPDEVGAYVERVVGHAADPALVTSLHDRTAGNPFFVAELVRLLRTEGRLGDSVDTPVAIDAAAHAVPQGVRDVIRSRLAQLPDGAIPVLTAAAIAGREFELTLVARVAEMDEDEVLDLVEAAWMIGIVDEVPDRPGHFEFAHELVRETLSDGLGTLRRIRLHRAVGEAIEAIHGVRNPDFLLECAYHFAEAAPGGDALKAVLYGQKAADRLTMQLAYEDAIGVYERANELVATYDVGTVATRNDLLIGLAWAMRSSGRLREARAVLDRAVDVARASGDAVRFARSVLGHGGGAFWGWWEEFGVTDHALIAQLEEAAAGLHDDEDAPLRCEVLGRLAVELYFTPDFSRRDALSAEAVETARRTGEPGALAAALAARHVAVWRPENLTERLALADELVDVASGAGLAERELIGRHLRIIDRFEAGDVRTTDEEFTRCSAIAAEIGQHSYSVQLAWFAAMRQFHTGDLAGAETMAQAAFESNLRANESAAWMALGAQLFQIRREQGRLDELEPLARQALTTQPHVGGAWLLAIGAIHAEAGRLDEARKIADEVIARDIPDFDNPMLRPVQVRELAELIAVLDHREAAAVLEPHLPQFVGEVLLLGTGHLCVGPTALVRGWVARAQGRLDDAVEHFVHAMEVADALDDQPHAVRSRWWLARTLVARDAGGDADRARTLLESAASTAAEHGFAMEARVRETLAALA
jgi:tetratricopeptide (TPR) repeat protein